MRSTRPLFYAVSAIVGLGLIGWTWAWLPAIGLLLAWAGVVALGVVDVVQPHSNIRRNFPVVGRLEELVVANRHILYQWVIESPRDGRPFNDVQRRIVARRASGAPDTAPFGSQLDRDGPGAAARRQADSR